MLREEVDQRITFDKLANYEFFINDYNGHICQKLPNQIGVYEELRPFGIKKEISYIKDYTTNQLLINKISFAQRITKVNQIEIIVKEVM